jgi:hypothetical protein
VVTLTLAGCARGPEWYAPPEQRQPLEPSGVGRLSSYVAMNDPNADPHLLRDVSHFNEGGGWRWAGPRPQMRFYLETTHNFRLSLDFVIAETTFKETGPVTLTFLINGRPFDKVRYAGPGEQHYEKPVPEPLLRAGQDNLVEIEFDRVWTSPDDGAKLSILLVHAGFARLGRYIAMNDPRAGAYLLRDISNIVEGDGWRWAGQRPMMRFYLETTGNLKFSLDFSIAEATFKDTGPMALTYLINGRPFDKARYVQAGVQHYEKPVPDSLLRAGQENLVEIEPDKVWTSKDDGAKLSIFLIRAGFIN